MASCLSCMSVITMSLSAAVWSPFATQIFRKGVESLRSPIGSYVQGGPIKTCHFTVCAIFDYRRGVRSIFFSDSWDFA